MSARQYNLFDRCLIQLQTGLSVLLSDISSHRENPAKDLTEPHLTEEQKKESARLMRVNHSGEICAQALYSGQMLIAKKQATEAMLEEAAEEEVDHLAWTHERIKELNGHRSYLNVVWYGNAFLIGVFAGVLGDRWSLGFVEETERQVTEHLEKHLRRLPNEDKKSRKIVEQMREDECRHGQNAASAGAEELPSAVKAFMAMQGRVMTTLSYWI